MRPEFTRAVGAGFVNTMNSIARSRGAQGIKSALAPVFGGNPATSTDRSLRYASGGLVQSFADGGIFGWCRQLQHSASAAFPQIMRGLHVKPQRSPAAPLLTKPGFQPQGHFR